LNEAKKQQVIARGRLGWSLRRIQKNTGVRRETAAAYLREAGVALRPPGAWGRTSPSKPANEAATDPAPAKPANEVATDLTPPEPGTGDDDPLSAKPANEVTTDFGVELAPPPGRAVHRPATARAIEKPSK
jgi:hypothetical protein